MYKNVSKYSYTALELREHYRDDDLWNHGIDMDGFNAATKQAAAIFSDNHYVPNLNVSKRKKTGKHLFTAGSIEEKLLIRQTSKILSHYLGIQAFSREDEVRQLCSLIRTEPGARIIRTDIKRFFESVPFQDCINSIVLSGLNNPSAIRHLKSLQTFCATNGAAGLPRGLSISSQLADFAMSNFDRFARSTHSCCYYCRYVDDVLIITTNTKVDSESEIRSHLPYGLQLNPKKTENEIIGTDKRIEFLGYSIHLLDPSKVAIADKKISKTKTRLALSLIDYAKTGNFDMFANRISYLTTNTIMKMAGREKPLIAGLRYSYPLADANLAAAQMKELDGFMFKLIFSSSYKPSIKAKAHMNQQQRRELHKFSFESAYKASYTIPRSQSEISAISEVWKHA